MHNKKIILKLSKKKPPHSEGVGGIYEFLLNYLEYPQVLS